MVQYTRGYANRIRNGGPTKCKNWLTLTDILSSGVVVTFLNAIIILASRTVQQHVKI